jgi:mRNA-degrading endonuclease YafQ of YafQ-DinJ toxin-antitoxin module
MKRVMVFKLVLLLLIAISPSTLSVPVGFTPGVFVATSPCDAGSKSLLRIPETADCEMIKWSLTLYQEQSLNPSTPATYKLDFVYGLPQQNTNGLVQGGTKIVREGKWTKVRGTKTNPDAVIYQLDPDKPQATISLQVIDHNLLHLLDHDQKLMIGNGGWSYTLNRAGGIGRYTNPYHLPVSIRAKVDSPIASALSPRADSPILGRFIGRSPCRDIARELNIPVNADCKKLKWDLTLYQNPNTHTPTRYTLKGTFYRAHTREGKWAIIKGAKTNPDVIIYQLDPDKSQGSLFFLKADDNILFFLSKEGNYMVGNADFSYTLNKN